MHDFDFIEYDIASCLGAKPSGNIIYGLADTDNPYIPETQSDFVPPAFVADLIAGFRLHSPIFLFGPTGCAKTAAVRWIASKFHMPFVSVTGHARLEFNDLIGHYSLKNSTLTWVDGPLLHAIRHGFVFCFDEITLCPPEILVGLHGILDRHPLCVPETNEIVPVHPQFRFIATDNTNGSGDESGQYLGTLQQNAAFLNRCFFVKASFLPEKQEKQLLLKYNNNRLPEDVICKMLKFANDVRFPIVGNVTAVNTTVSVRDLYRWIDAAHIFLFLAKSGKNVIYYALKRAILYRCTPVDISTLTELFRVTFGVELEGDEIE